MLNFGGLIWAPIVFAGIPVIGILAAVGLPAYQHHTERQSSAVEADPYAEKQAVRDVPDNKQPGLFDDVIFPKAGGNAQPNQGTTTDVIAQLNLGIKHDMGKGVPQNYVEAAKWYRLAAAQGNAIAQNKLGTLYYDGKGVTQDYIRAHLWFNLGAASGSADAVKSRDAVAGRMTPQQIAEAQQIARDCQQRNYKGCD